jgi:hypothetical protein
MSPNKVIAIPICWALYECPSNVFEVLGAAVTTPPPIVLEALVSQGSARVVKVISSDIHEHGEIVEAEDEEQTGETPWFPGS